jgi:hypothetical protein
MYKCEKCEKEFKYKYLLRKHENRKFTCENVKHIEFLIDDKINNLEKEIETKTRLSLEKKNICMFCNLTLSIKTSTMRHINKYCKVKKELMDEKNKLVEDKLKKEEKEDNNKLKEELKILKDKVEHLETKKQITQNITINNTQNNLVMINPFGKEDLSHISLQDYKKYLNGFFPGLVEYIEKVHFDEKAPQNHNICISNLKSKYITVHNGTRWITQMRDDVIDRFINRKHNQLIDKREELEDLKKIDKKVIDNFDEFCEALEDNEAKKSIKNDVITMLYDNKDKINIKKKDKNKVLDLKCIEIENKNDEDLKPKKKIKPKKK